MAWWGCMQRRPCWCWQPHLCSTTSIVRSSAPPKQEHHSTNVALLQSHPQGCTHTHSGGCSNLLLIKLWCAAAGQGHGCCARMHTERESAVRRRSVPRWKPPAPVSRTSGRRIQRPRRVARAAMPHTIVLSRRRVFSLPFVPGGYACSLVLR